MAIVSVSVVLTYINTLFLLIISSTYKSFGLKYSLSNFYSSNNFRRLSTPSKITNDRSFVAINLNSDKSMKYEYSLDISSSLDIAHSAKSTAARERIEAGILEEEKSSARPSLMHSREHQRLNSYMIAIREATFSLEGVYLSSKYELLGDKRKEFPSKAQFLACLETLVKDKSIEVNDLGRGIWALGTLFSISKDEEEAIPSFSPAIERCILYFEGLLASSSRPELYTIAACNVAVGLGRVFVKSEEIIASSVKESIANILMLTIPFTDYIGMSGCVHALGSLRIQFSTLSPVFRKMIFKQITVVLPDSNAKALSGLLWGLHGMQVHWSSIPSIVQDALMLSISRLCFATSGRAVGNILLALGRLGLRRKTIPEGSAIALELSVRSAKGRYRDKDVLQTLQGLGSLCWPWLELSSETRLGLASACYSRVVDQLREAGMCDPREAGTVLHSLGSMNVKWVDLPGALRASIALAFVYWPRVRQGSGEVFEGSADPVLKAARLGNAVLTQRSKDNAIEMISDEVANLAVEKSQDHATTDSFYVDHESVGSVGGDKVDAATQEFERQLRLEIAANRRRGKFQKTQFNSSVDSGGPDSTVHYFPQQSFDESSPFLSPDLFVNKTFRENAFATTDEMARALSSCLNSLALVEAGPIFKNLPPLAVERLITELPLLLPHMTAQGLSNTLFSLPRLGIQWGQLPNTAQAAVFSALSSVLIEKISNETTLPSVASNISAGTGTSTWSAGTAQAVANALFGLKDIEFPFNSLSSTMQCDLVRVVVLLVARLDKPREAVQLLYSLGKARLPVLTDKPRKYDQIERHSKPAQLARGLRRDLLSAIPLLTDAKKVEVVDRWMFESLRDSKELTPHDITMLLVSLRKLNICFSDVLSAGGLSMARALLSFVYFSVPELTAQGLEMTLLSLASMELRWGKLQPSLRRCLQQRISELIEEGKFSSPRSLLKLLSSLAAMNASYSQHIVLHLPLVSECFERLVSENKVGEGGLRSWAILMRISHKLGVRMRDLTFHCQGAIYSGLAGALSVAGVHSAAVQVEYSMQTRGDLNTISKALVSMLRVDSSNGALRESSQQERLCTSEGKGMTAEYYHSYNEIHWHHIVDKILQLSREMSIN